MIIDDKVIDEDNIIKTNLYLLYECNYKNKNMLKLKYMYMPIPINNIHNHNIN